MKKFCLLISILFSIFVISCGEDEDSTSENTFYVAKNVMQIKGTGLSEYSDLKLKIGYYPSKKHYVKQQFKEWAEDFDFTFSEPVDINYFFYDGGNPPRYRATYHVDDGIMTVTFTKFTEESIEPLNSSFTGKYTTPTNGYVTWYDGAAASSVAYYTPELLSGWYHCAVSEPKYDELPAGTAIELTANGKTVHILVTDLCPTSENSHHTSKANYFFDLEKSAFTSLADATVGELNMTFKTIPYPTTDNIKFLAKDGINEWWLAGKFYNCRYPLKKVEWSKDGTTFTEMQKLAGHENNWYKAEGEGLTSKLIFRLTDVYGQVVTTNAVTGISAEKSYDTGVNFGW